MRNAKRKEEVHPDYLLVMEEFRDDDVVSPLRALAVGRLSGQKLVFCIFVLISGAFCGGYAFGRISAGAALLNFEQPKIDETTKQALGTNLEEEVNLITDVLRKLVPTVKELAMKEGIKTPAMLRAEVAQSEQTALNPLELVRVTSERANLRETPRVDGKLVMAISEGTELVVDEDAGDWMKVTAPNGKPAWIHSSVTSVVQGGQGE